MTSGEPERFGHARITGGQIACQSCRQWRTEVVLLEPGRPLCLGCVGEQLGAGVESIREWLHSGKLRAATPGRRGPT